VQQPLDVSTVNDAIELPKQSAHHLLNVLRVGKRVFATIETKNPNPSESPLRATLVQSISRGDRMDRCVQKSVELGVHSIQPVYTHHAIPKLSQERAMRKLSHWQAIVVSAAEQSGRSHLPDVFAPQSLVEWLQTSWQEAKRGGAIGWVLAPSASIALGSAPVTKADAEKQPHYILIGPETGLEPSEISAAVDAGFHAIRFGPRILRTETAGPAVLSALQTLFGDLLA